MARRMTTEDWIVSSVNYALLAVITLITLYPFYYLIIVSFNSGQDTLLGGIYFWPRDFTLENYQAFFSDSKWVKAFGISVLRTVVGGAAGVFFTCLVAYGLSYKDLLFKKLYFVLVIIAMYFSGGLIPYYVLLRELHLINTFWVYVIPSLLNIFFLLIAVSFFREIPKELHESAKIDGANDLSIFFRIIIPVSMPLIATMGLFIGVGQWNSWLDSAYFVQSENLRTLTYRMMEIINQSNISQEAAAFGRGSSSVTSFSIQVTAMVIAVAPIMCVYPFLQKYFVKGMMLGSVKE
ncbi:putative aldouronate transport system permease protein [Evansella caseinilytica]|uniref:Putative aldouronate transport system permease protein n=1 Tax=Evansella caseinilytica TaxID=1503961 RepID=A0A1H3V1L0_9BACI|nr:carbohydrate ABC transporter permease [Evansella caseinilytica]SDZ67969.1 putative aldouronate transport system permease protein [Evansella caseinilytica]